jgi:hypothetical protein
MDRNICWIPECHKNGSQALQMRDIHVLTQERYTTYTRLEMLSLEPPKHHRCSSRVSEQPLQRICGQIRDHEDEQTEQYYVA